MYAYSTIYINICIHIYIHKPVYVYIGMNEWNDDKLLGFVSPLLL